MTARNREIAIVFDGPPGPESGRFVEVEVDGHSVKLGRWEQVDSFSSVRPACWELRFTPEDAQRALGEPAVWLDHVYNGPAVRLPKTPGDLLEIDTLTGAFHVSYRDDVCAVIDNGEEPRGRWLVTMLDWLVKA